MPYRSRCTGERTTAADDAALVDVDRVDDRVGQRVRSGRIGQAPAPLPDLVAHVDERARFIGDDGITLRELETAVRASCNVAGLERWGWISIGDDRDKRRDGFGTRRGITSATVLRPTRAGIAARRLWPRAIEEVEGRWRARFGVDAIDTLTGALRATLAGRDGEMPWSPPEVHPSDGFRSHVVDRTAGSRTSRDEPLVALLGQALTALTLDSERGARASLPVAANVLRVVDDHARVRDDAARSGVSKEADAMALAFAERRGLARRAADRMVLLTPDGSEALADYRRRATRTDDVVLRAALECIVSRRDALAEGLVPPDGCWRAERPYATATRRMIADPTGALPWQPMVLHRGGWPDGS